MSNDDNPVNAAPSALRCYPSVVWLLTTGSGFDGDEWGVISIHATEEGAKEAKAKHESPRIRPDGSTYFFEANIEQWSLEK